MLCLQGFWLYVEYANLQQEVQVKTDLIFLILFRKKLIYVWMDHIKGRIILNGLLSQLRI